MMITMEGSKAGDPDQALEFTNINREELGPMNTYINDILKPAMAREVAESEGDNKAEPICVDEVVEAEVVDASMTASDVGRLGKRPRSGRGAAKAATDATRAQLAGGNFDSSDEDDDSEEEGDYSDDDDGDEGSEEEGGSGDEDDESEEDSDDDEGVFADVTEEDLMMEIEATIKEAGGDEHEGGEGSNKKQKV
jgi:hypothetical protein